jgi:hypothetical protein
MSRRTRSTILAFVILPVLTGQMVLVLAFSALLHFVTHDHDHEIVTRSVAGAVSVEMAHDDHESGEHEPTDLPAGSHSFSLNNDYTFSLVKKLIEHNDQLAVYQLPADYVPVVQSEQSRAYRTVAEDPPERVADRSAILRI